jgi:hypothetical protein
VLLFRLNIRAVVVGFLERGLRCLLHVTDSVYDSAYDFIHNLRI